MKRLLWMIVQALAVGGLTWMFVNPDGPPTKDPPPSPVFIVIVSIVIVAFLTALWTNVSDWALRTARESGPIFGTGLILFILSPLALLAVVLVRDPHPLDATAFGWVPLIATMGMAVTASLAYGAISLTRAFRRRRSGPTHGDEPIEKGLLPRAGFGRGEVTKERGRLGRR